MSDSSMAGVEWDEAAQAACVRRMCWSCFTDVETITFNQEKCCIYKSGSNECDRCAEEDIECQKIPEGFSDDVLEIFSLADHGTVVLKNENEAFGEPLTSALRIIYKLVKQNHTKEFASKDTVLGKLTSIRSRVVGLEKTIKKRYPAGNASDGEDGDVVTNQPNGNTATNSKVSPTIEQLKHLNDAAVVGMKSLSNELEGFGEAWDERCLDGPRSLDSLKQLVENTVHLHCLTNRLLQSLVSEGDA
ncbi:MAG: hypothetical protein M1823_005328 [Watsoniomyces obsoletus]|nr:MAG: hypothetical protein M1823_005328 [Watsoniomyces obsoletus]